MPLLVSFLPSLSSSASCDSLCTTLPLLELEMVLVAAGLAYPPASIPASNNGAMSCHQREAPLFGLLLGSSVVSHNIALGQRRCS